MSRDATLTKIAAQHLGLETLDERRRDCLDFSHQGVWAIKAALDAAYEAGRQAAAKGRVR